jgi:hypothetical protein
MPKNKPFCCNPLNIHKKHITHNVYKVNTDIVSIAFGILKDSDFLCVHCRMKIICDPTILKEAYNNELKSTTSGSSDDGVEPIAPYLPDFNIIQEEVLPLLDESPFKSS